MKIEDYWNVMLYWVCSSDVAKDCSSFIFQVKQTRETAECVGNYVGGLISFASAVIFLFTLDIAG